jgi:6-phosphogluconolactonase (cycloisomerase 2 family)
MNPGHCFLRAAQAVVAIAIVAGAASAQAIYVPNFTTSNVSGYVANPSTGALDAVPGSPFRTGQSPVQALIHPSGKFLYVLDAGAGDVTLYSISAPSGALNLLGCPRCDALSPAAMAMDPAGQFLFVVSSTNAAVTSYAVNPATGALTKGISVGTGSGSRPVHAVVDPTGRYLYVANSGTGQAAGFQVNGGALTPMQGSPYPAGSGPSSVAASRTNVYVTNLFSADISVYQITGGGTLAPAGNSIPTLGSPSFIAVDSSGYYIYVANQSQVLAYNTSQNGVYPLTVVQSVNAGNTPSYVAVAPEGNFVYVVNTTSNDVSGFSISAGGTLIPAGSSSTFGTSGQRLLTVQHIGDTTAISFTSGFPAPAAAAYGTPVQLKGAVRNTRNPGVFPTGSVTITANGNAVPNGTVALDPSGAFDLTFNAGTQFLPVGSSIIKAAYNPATGFEAPVPSAIVYTVTKATPAFTITPSPASPIAAQPMTIRVSSQQTGARYPEGTVLFSVDGAAVGNAVPLVNGTAQISYTPATGDHTVTVNFSGDAFFFPLNVQPVNFHANHLTTTALSSNTTSLVYGQTALLTATLSAGGGPVAGTVDFYDNGLKLNGAPVTISAGQVQFAPLSLLSVGTHSITAIYGGDTNNLPSNNSATPLIVTVNRASVTTSSPLSSGAAVFGQVVTFTVTVAAAAPGGGVPSGSIVFRDLAVTLGAAVLSAGTASFSTANLTAGSHTITAAYNGDANFLGGTSPGLQLSIACATQTVTASASPQSPVVRGQQVTLTAALAGTGAATGTVEFSLSGTSIGSAALTGKSASLSYIPTSPGTPTITASYSGDSNNLPVFGAATLIVNQASVTVSTPSISGTPVVGQPLTFSVSVAAQAPGGGIPTGTVTFQDGPASVGTQPLAAGSASFTTSSLAVGLRSITATYNGDVGFTSATSAAHSVTIGRSAPTVSVSVDAPALILGQAVTFTMRVGSGPALAGTVDVFDNGTKINAAPVPVAANHAQFGPYALTSVGSHAITASYSGDAYYGSASSNANPVIVTVSQAPVNISAPLLSGAAVYGSPVTFTVTVAAAQGGLGIPSGTVVFKDGTSLLGSAPLSNGTALLTNSTLGAGTHLITAAYSGDSNFLANTSAAVTVPIGKATPTISLGPITGSTPVVGQTIALVAVVDGGPSLTGTVDFFDTGSKVNSTPIPLTGGRAQFAYTLPSAGTHYVTASYHGGLNFNAVSTDPSPVSLAVAQGQASASVLVDSGLPTFGHPLVVLATVSAVAPGSGTPTGVVTLSDGAVALGISTIVAGRASVPLSTLSAGNHSLFVTYGGDSNFAGTTSPTLRMIVDREPTSTILTISQSSNTMTLTAQVASSLAIVPTGSVRFFNNGAALGTAMLAPVGGAAIANFQLGETTGTITAVYSGSPNFYGSTSAPAGITATPRSPTTLALKFNPVPATSGEPVTCTVTLASNGTPTPSGTIQLFDGSVLLGSGPVIAGSAAFKFALDAGSHNLIASYTGDARNAPSSTTLGLLVNKISGTLALSSRSTAAASGSMVTLTATLGGGSTTATAPAGRIDFLDGSSVIGTVPLANRTATLALPALSPGTHVLSSHYAGDPNWSPVTSNAISIAVTKAVTLVDISAVPGVSESGKTTVTASVATMPAGIGAPTGIVRFIDAATGQVLDSAEITGTTASGSIPDIASHGTILAVYQGDAKFESASSAPVTQFSVANAASYDRNSVAPDEIVTVFGPRLTTEPVAAWLPLPDTLGGASVTLTDSKSVTRRASIFNVLPTQLSFLVPSDMALGPATLRITVDGGAVMTAVVNVDRVSPGLFTANSNGQGVAAAQTVRVHPGPIVEDPRNIAAFNQMTQSWIATPIDLGSPEDETYLALFATGIRHGDSPLTVEIDGQSVPALYAGAHPVYAGLDQVNILIPPSLRAGGSVTASISTTGRKSNTVELVFLPASTR